MCVPMAAVALAVTAASAVAGGIQAYQASSNAKAAAEYNAEVQQQAAQQEIQAGEDEVDAHRRKVAQIHGRQKTLLAAGNVDVEWGTPERILADTQYYGDQDAAIIRHNAERRAWAKRAGATLSSFEASTHKPLVSAGGAALSGAASGASMAQGFGWFD